MSVKNALSEIKDILKNKQDVYIGLKYIEECLRDIQISGQKLESRCQTYRDSIENLGFKRVKNKNKRK
jgi:hypothetical protein